MFQVFVFVQNLVQTSFVLSLYILYICIKDLYICFYSIIKIIIQFPFSSLRVMHTLIRNFDLLKGASVPVPFCHYNNHLHRLLFCVLFLKGIPEFAIQDNFCVVTFTLSYKSFLLLAFVRVCVCVCALVSWICSSSECRQFAVSLETLSHFGRYFANSFEGALCYCCCCCYFYCYSCVFTGICIRMCIVCFVLFPHCLIVATKLPLFYYCYCCCDTLLFLLNSLCCPSVLFDKSLRMLTLTSRKIY